MAPPALPPAVAKHGFPLSDFSAGIGHAAALVLALPAVLALWPRVVADGLAQVVGLVGAGPARGQAVPPRVLAAAVREQLFELVGRVPLLVGQPENYDFLLENFFLF